jgi:DNA-binding MarR family transcriptional regulator
MSSTHPGATPERIELARAIAASLPKFGEWASTSRQFDTPYGRLGYRRISILWVLRHEMIEPKHATTTGLARFFRVQPSVLTRALASMETAGLISRSADPGDSRVIRVEITELGLEVSRYVEDLYIGEVLEAIAPLSESAICPLAESVQQLDAIADELDRRRFERTCRAPHDSPNP